MTVISLPEALAWGAAGGLALSMVDLLEDLARPHKARRCSDPTYWIGFAFRPLLGLMLVLLYLRSDSVLNALSAFGTGLTAPSILQVLARKVHVPLIATPGPPEA